MMDITNNVNDCCEQLAAKKELITTRRVEQELLDNATLDKNEIVAQAHKIPKLISTWRIIKLRNTQQIDLDQNSEPKNELIDKALQMPAKVDLCDFMELQRKTFSLENELNRYKHATFRANSKAKCLEKKLHSVRGQVDRERRVMIDCLREMLCDKHNHLQ